MPTLFCQSSSRAEERGSVAAEFAVDNVPSLLPGSLPSLVPSLLPSLVPSLLPSLLPSLSTLHLPLTLLTSARSGRRGEASIQQEDDFVVGHRCAARGPE